MSVTSIKRDENVLYTSAGDFPLNQYILKYKEKEWKIKHVSSVLSRAEEDQFLLDMSEKLPFGIALWTSSIALAHEIASRSEFFQGKQVLELGSGTGLPGIVASTFKGRVVQTDRNELAMSLCRRNLKLNNVETTQRLEDWSDWQDSSRYDWIIGSDILYSEEMHPFLLKIFENNLSSEGRILISDPFREVSIKFLGGLEDIGWEIRFSKWSVGEEELPRVVGVFDIRPPIKQTGGSLA